MPGIRRIALLMGQDLGYCRDVLRGVQTYAQGRSDWVFRDAPPTLDVIAPLRDWRPHGIICHLFLPELAAALKRMRRPVVNTTSTLADLKLPLVENDHAAIGRLAAEHFLERGYRHFGYFGSGQTCFSRDRERAFRARLKEAGCSVASCHADYLPRPPPGSNWRSVDRRVQRWLVELPKPVAVFASNDVPARDLADTCLAAGLRVPDQVAILGVDNDEVECRLARPPLSSVAVAGERIGFEAARMLDQLMRGRSPGKRVRWVPPVRVVTRQSTDTTAIDEPGVAAALATIRERFAGDLSVAAVADVVAVGRRVLERGFRKHLGRSVLSEIRRVRIERAKELLTATALPMPDVARRSGFSNARRLAVVFRQETGITPTDFRRLPKPEFVDDAK